MLASFSPEVEKARAEAAAFDAILADLTAKFPTSEVEPYVYSGGRLALRTPDEAEFAKWMDDKAARGAHLAAVALCMRCVVYPDAAATAVILKRKPGLAHRIGDVILNKAGSAEEIRAGK